MFCSKCGKEIMDEAVICPNCGCATNNSKAQSSAISQESQEYSVLSSINGLTLPARICAFLVPLVGLILSLVGFSKISSTNTLQLSEDASKQLFDYKVNFKTSLIISIIVMVVAPIVCLIGYLVLLEAFF